MEIMLIAVVSPLIRCEWQLHDWQVALVTTVSDLCSPMQVILHKGSVCSTTRLRNITFPNRPNKFQGLPSGTGHSFKIPGSNLP